MSGMRTAKLVAQVLLVLRRLVHHGLHQHSSGTSSLYSDYLGDHFISYPYVEWLVPRSNIGAFLQVSDGMVSLLIIPRLVSLTRLTSKGNSNR